MAFNTTGDSYTTYFEADRSKRSETRQFNSSGHFHRLHTHDSALDCAFEVGEQDSSNFGCFAYKASDARIGFGVAQRNEATYALEIDSSHNAYVRNNLSVSGTILYDSAWPIDTPVGSADINLGDVQSGKFTVEVSTSIRTFGIITSKCDANSLVLLTPEWSSELHRTSWALHQVIDNQFDIRVEFGSGTGTANITFQFLIINNNTPSTGQTWV